MMNALKKFRSALQAFGEQDFENVARYCREAIIADPLNPVYTEGVRYLDRVLREGKQNVYATGDGFAAFIRGGGNMPLYVETSAALRRVYERYGHYTLLDVGSGDGRALLPAITTEVTRLDLVEPSSTMLEQLGAALQVKGLPYHSYCGTLQTFVKESSAQWNIIQATFSLQSIPSHERPALLEWLASHGERLLITEFDVPQFEDLYSLERIQHIVERYVHGLAEYAQDGGSVAQSFLMPVMFGYFDRTAARTNYEQPLENWIEQLKAARFTQVDCHLLYSYWWAPAYFIEAQV